MIKPRLGQYFYAPRGYNWGIWKYTSVTENGSSAEKVTEFREKYEAIEFVYRMNGWSKKKTA